MPTFDITAPDGKVYEIEGANAEGALAALQKHLGGSSPPALAAPQEVIDQPVADPMGAMLPWQAAPPALASMSYGDQMAKVGGALDKGARLIANGATFGLADKFAGGMNALTGQAPSYDAGVKAERAKTEEIRQAVPGPALAAEVAGGVLTGTGLMKGGLTLAGRMGPSLFGRSLGYGIEGAGYGAAQGAGNTYSNRARDYIDNAFTGGATGFGFGAALPVLGAGAAGAYRAGSAFLGPRIEGAGAGASALLRAAAQADEAGIRALPAMGPEAMLVDAGPAMLGLGQGAGTGTGAGRAQLVNSLRTRDIATGPRLSQTLDEVLGPAPIPSRVEAGLNGSRAQVAQQYEPALANAQAVNTAPLAEQLEALAINLRGPEQRAVRQVREMLDIPGERGVLDPHPRALLSTRQAIDGLLEGEVNPRVVQQLTAARAAVDDELARAVPGIKEVDAQIAELHRQSAGLTRGGQVFDTGKTATRPAELVQEISEGALPQGTQIGPSAAPTRMRQGTRAEIDRLIGTNVNDLTALERKLGTPQDWNNQKLGIVFSPQQRDAVVDALTNNRKFRQAYSDIVQNSQTAQRSSSAAAMEGAPGGNVDAGTTVTGLGLKAVNKLAKLISGAANANTKDDIGRILSAQGPAAQRIAAELLDSAQKTGANASTIARVLSAPQVLYGVTAPTSGRTGRQ